LKDDILTLERSKDTKEAILMSKELIQRIERYKDATEKTYFQVAYDLGVPEATLHRWRKKPESIQKGYLELVNIKLKKQGF